MKTLTIIIATFGLMAIAACGDNDTQTDAQQTMDHSTHTQTEHAMMADTMHAMGVDSMHATAATDTTWACPMNCIEPQKTAGRCTACGMNLVMRVAAVTDSTNNAPMSDEHSGHNH